MQGDKNICSKGKAMEKMLLKMAHQLNAMDEASLMSLWDAYLAKVQDFDGSEEWEEAAIVLSLIQAVKGKNQLFNAYLAEMNHPERSRLLQSQPRPAIPPANVHVQRHAVVHQFHPVRQK